MPSVTECVQASLNCPVLNMRAMACRYTMDFLIWATLGLVAIHFLNAAEQGRRVVLLGRHLSQYRIEKLMERLTDGYQRALSESEQQRRDAIWLNLHAVEEDLYNQFARFVMDFARLDEPLARVSRLPLAIPFATALFGQACFDMRKLLAIHAHGFGRVVDPAAHSALPLSPRDRAYTMLAEMLLMQHSCHWFCKSKTIASARLLARHQTSHAQVLNAVTPETRQAYQALTGHPV